MTNILIVDDDINILKLLGIQLTDAGYQVFGAKDGIEALKILKKERCNLAVVDVMMPYIDGYALTREIRKQYDIPVILLTAKNQIEDKEEGFQSGTDDYLIKPFEPKELIFRIKALLRRYDSQSDESTIRIGDTIINKKSYEVKIGDRTILLPLKEFELLNLLFSNPAQVFSRDQLIGQIWGLDYEGDDRTVDVHIKRLRERFSKLSDDFQIKTVRGVGYLLEVKRR
ncbi:MULTISPECIES: response regulator transcription factor [unclassified Bacillus (in: firmicutes)]|uniref:response regulator transcription factor n=1 Tax=unclassified Bacillus (in: firmicutes) TaxID=185979 RepID=UPI0008E67987|nr:MULTISPECIES: response regulator transcription factor [unclassified Bacillus (in: firmicutes)]SFA87226.1 DNA-binding response regulator, OmpR family, contains REC and winged-helix (wHTH) domain [Bacillus sp. UNCCL13]SFQ84133.1 DNA-binding response regulator, OmpR family, contains REC and winged-helix (wHTH) domain [Bacillus sp. cl95]